MCFTNGLVGLPIATFARVFAHGLLSWTLCGLTPLAQAQNPLVPEDPKDRVGPGMAELFERVGPHPEYKPTRNHMHVGFRWQPYVDQPKNSEADIERELGKVGSYASFWYMSLHTLPQKRNLDYNKHPSKEAQAIRHAVNSFTFEHITMDKAESLYQEHEAIFKQ